MTTETTPHLRFKGDWGAFNLTRICGWLAWGVFERTGSYRHVIHTGRGMADNLLALADGEVDVTISTPAGFARMAREGRGLFEDRPLRGLRAIGVVPHRDALLIALPAELGIETMAQLREVRPALRLALGPDDGENFMGFGARSLLEASGISVNDIGSWGGKLVYGEDPSQCVAHVMEGRADAIIQEAIMTPWWKRLARERPLRFLSLEPAAEAKIAQELLLGAIEVPAGFLDGMREPVRAIDFRGWQVLVRDDLPDEIATLLTEAMGDSPEVMENQYRHLEVRDSPLDYPITRERLAEVTIPLHPGAAAYYERHGIVVPSGV
jgi:TRAP-type uncharacterized transport system substrate-binding protein